VVLRFVVGVLIGGIVVAGFFFISDSGDSGSDPVAVALSTTLAGATTIAPTSTTTEVPWVMTGEARFESTVLLPRAMSVDGGVAMLEYDLTTLGPVLAGDVFEDSTWVPVQPERWVLVTSTGSFDAETLLGADKVRFDVSDAASLDDVSAVHLVGWRTVMPVEHVFEMPLESGETVTFPDSGSITVKHVLEQSNSTIVKFDTHRPGDEFAANPVEWHLAPVAGQGWRQSWTVENGFQIVHDDPSAPASVLLRYNQPMWLPVAGDIVVWEGGAP
jgi:hypothetical protein